MLFRLLVLILFLPLNAIAAPPSWCIGLTWPVSRDVSIAELSEDFEHIDRFELTQYAWGELTTTNEKPMFVPILAYLAGTENNADLRGYYKAMGYFALGKKELPEALKKWPERAAHNGKGFSLEELCQMYKKSGGAVPLRDPSSKKPSVKKKAAPKKVGAKYER